MCELAGAVRCPCDGYLMGFLLFSPLAALQEKRIRGAALDVTETEPLPEDSPLWDLDNVLLSPHCADRTATFQVPHASVARSACMQ